MSQLLQMLGDAWRWWLTEFLSLPPVGKLRRLARSRRRMLTLAPGEGFTEIAMVTGDEPSASARIDDDAPAEQAHEVGALTGKRSTKVVGVIPRSQLLTRQLSLPSAAERHLRDAVRFQLERISPFPDASAVFDARVAGRDRAQNIIRVQVRILSHSVVQDLEERAARLGLAIDAFAVRTADGALDILDLLSQPASEKGWALEDKALWGAASLLAASLILAPLLKEMQAADVLAEQAAALKPKADQAMKLQKERDKLLASRAEVIGMKIASAPPLRILARLSELMDDDAYLLEYRSEGGSITISGFAADASKLLQRLETAPELKSVRFSGPLNRDAQTGRDRFTLTIDAGATR